MKITAKFDCQNGYWTAVGEAKRVFETLKFGTVEYINIHKSVNSYVKTIYVGVFYLWHKKRVSSSLCNHVIIILKLFCSGIRSMPQTKLWVRNGGRSPRYMKFIECYQGNQIQDNILNWTWVRKRDKRGVYKLLIVNILGSDHSTPKKLIGR